MRAGVDSMYTKDIQDDGSWENKQVVLKKKVSSESDLPKKQLKLKKTDKNKN